MDNQLDSSMLRSWESRDKLYRELFGDHKYSVPKHYAPPKPPEEQNPQTVSNVASLLGKTTNEKDIPILAYEPTDLRPYWIYLTSGLSNPWFGATDGEVSGFGCELMIKSATDARWPIELLQRLAYYVLSYSGTLSPGVSLIMDTPLLPTGKSELEGLIIWYADEAPDCIYQLPFGVFGIFSVIGITQDENDFVRSVDQYGCWCLQQILRLAGHQQITDPKRHSVMKEKNIDDMVKSVRQYADNFREPQ